MFVGLYRIVKSSAGYPLSLINYHHKSDSRANSDKPFNKNDQTIIHAIYTHTHTRICIYLYVYISVQIYMVNVMHMHVACL